MNASLLTTLAFVALTVLAIVLHLRGRSGPTASGGRCPRCHARFREGTELCPGCGAPTQAFELVTAPIAAPVAANGGVRHALVRADVCVGCGTCVGVCPEPGALRVVDHRAVVNVDLCKGHGNCVAACPVNAIVIGTGRAVQELEVPQLDANFQSNVPGLYIVGELGGRGLIKNAINEGKLAVEHIAKTLAREPRIRPGSEIFDLLIVGSGPAGLSAGLEARRQGLNAVLLEQGTLAETISKYPRQKLLLAEPVKVPLYGDLWVADASKEELLSIWERAIESAGLTVLTHRRVEAVTSDGTALQVAAGGETFRARRVVLAMGRRGTPRRLGVDGEALGKVFYDIVEMEAFAGRRVLVVGGGDSAVESGLGLANQPGTEVTLSYRGEAFARIKERNRAHLDEAVSAGRLQLMLRSDVREIRDAVVVLERPGGSHVLPNDVVIIRIGGEAPYPFLERIGVRIIRKEIAFQPAQVG